MLQKMPFKMHHGIWRPEYLLIFEAFAESTKTIVLILNHLNSFVASYNATSRLTEDF